jgi:hypothetical protein
MLDGYRKSIVKMCGVSPMETAVEFISFEELPLKYPEVCFVFTERFESEGASVSYVIGKEKIHECTYSADGEDDDFCDCEEPEK